MCAIGALSGTVTPIISLKYVLKSMVVFGIKVAFDVDNLIILSNARFVIRLPLPYFSNPNKNQRLLNSFTWYGWIVIFVLFLYNYNIVVEEVDDLWWRQ